MKLEMKLEMKLNFNLKPNALLFGRGSKAACR